MKVFIIVWQLNDVHSIRKQLNKQSDEFLMALLRYGSSQLIIL